MTTQLTNIEHLEDIDSYSPPGHSRTVNAKLVNADGNGLFEMIHGTIKPGGKAEWHQHDCSYQAIFILSGCARVKLEGSPVKECGANTIIRIPSGLGHEVISLGDTPLNMVLIYSPPLK